MTIAVIQTGGKQYIVKVGDTIQVEKLAQAEGETVQFSHVVLLAEEDGNKLNVGQPIINGATVSGKILRQFRGKKIRIGKFKSKVRYRRTRGHRQHYSAVQVTDIKVS